MFKEFIDQHSVKATHQANQFTEEEGVVVKNFTAFADNLAKVHLIVEFEEAPSTKKSVAKTPAKRTSTKSTTVSK